ncbi:MAG: radical SAM protein [Thermoproteota archaeon]|nr:radical SAM protein [Thermoproteota archaeon]
MDLVSNTKENSRINPENSLSDRFGRVARKLRPSITDKCNMECIYCMPRDLDENGNDKFGSGSKNNKNNNNKALRKRWLTKDEVLTYEEFVRISRIMSKLGIEKIRVTGGEPLIRPKVEDLIARLSEIPGIKSVSMTTNGIYLADKADLLKRSGLQSVNISLDTFKPERFKSMCGVDGLQKVLNSISASENAGLQVKINTVVVRGWNDDEVVNFANFARETGHVVRFIEFMPLDGSGIWLPDLVVSKSEIISKIRYEVCDLQASRIVEYNGITSSGNNNEDVEDTSAPAKIFSFTDGRGTLGFIPSMTEPFCSQCDRMRITSDGRLLTCLFENPGYDIRNLLRNGKSDQEISDYVLGYTKRKPEGVISIIRSKSLKPTLNLMHTIGG